MRWNELIEPIFLYLGGHPTGTGPERQTLYKGEPVLAICVDKDVEDHKHILHDLTDLPYPLPDESIIMSQAEDVLEHIDPELLVPIINEIFRISKPSSRFRISVPDYRSKIYEKELLYDVEGKPVQDKRDLGHEWLPLYETLDALVRKTEYGRHPNKIVHLHYIEEDGTIVTKYINHDLGKVARTSDFDNRAQNPHDGLSLVVDLWKA
jgi:predicted SAM-dependent methyltransferase